MANEINWSDDEAINDFFNNDSDEEFLGFAHEDVELADLNVIRAVPMSDFVPETDHDLPGDLENGWVSEDTPPTNAPFTGEARLNVDMESFNPIDFLKLFINDDFYDLLVQQTNIYAESRLNAAGALSPHSRLRKWTAVTIDEMKVFISLTIAMGLVFKSDVQDYWSGEDCPKTPFVCKNMKRDGFLAILSNFHRTDNNDVAPRGDPNFDPLFKIRPFITLVTASFSDVYENI